MTASENIRILANQPLSLKEKSPQKEQAQHQDHCVDYYFDKAHRFFYPKDETSFYCRPARDVKNFQNNFHLSHGRYICLRVTEHSKRAGNDCNHYGYGHDG